MGKVYGYARVSTKGQKLDRQIVELKSYNPNIILFTDKKSGRDFDRKEYEILKRIVDPGDTIVVKEMERFGRNKKAIKEELEYFNKKGVRVVILDIPTTTMDLSSMEEGIAKEMIKMITNILIEVLATVAETDYKKIKTRQAEGIAVAKQKGQHLGRPKAEYPPLWEMYYTQWKNKESGITAKECMDQLGLKKTTFYKLVKKFEETQK